MSSPMTAAGAAEGPYETNTDNSFVSLPEPTLRRAEKSPINICLNIYSSLPRLLLLNDYQIGSIACKKKSLLIFIASRISSR